MLDTVAPTLNGGRLVLDLQHIAGKKTQGRLKAFKPPYEFKILPFDEDFPKF